MISELLDIVFNLLKLTKLYGAYLGMTRRKVSEFAISKLDQEEMLELNSKCHSKRTEIGICGLNILKYQLYYN